ncbi:hypothetical protein V1279_003127 [Bradyrhizobium sp. AZCC 1610]
MSSQPESNSEKLILLRSQYLSALLVSCYLGAKILIHASHFLYTTLEFLLSLLMLGFRFGLPSLPVGAHFLPGISRIVACSVRISFSLIKALRALAEFHKFFREFSPYNIGGRWNHLLDLILKISSHQRAGSKKLELLENFGWLRKFFEPHCEFKSFAKAGQFLFKSILLATSCSQLHLTPSRPHTNNYTDRRNEGRDKLNPIGAGRQRNNPNHKNCSKEQERNRKKIIALFHRVKLTPLCSFVEGVAA